MQATTALASPQRLAFSVDEAAAALGCSRVTIYNAFKRGDLRAVKIGARTVIPASEIERLLAGDGAK